MRSAPWAALAPPVVVPYSILYAAALPHQPLENHVMFFLKSWVLEESFPLKCAKKKTFKDWCLNLQKSPPTPAKIHEKSTKNRWTILTKSVKIPLEIRKNQKKKTKKRKNPDQRTKRRVQFNFSPAKFKDAKKKMWNLSLIHI